MRQIPPPVVDDAQVLDDIIAAKRAPRRALLTAVRAKVIEAYGQYVANAPAVENLPAVALSETQAAALVHAYEVETAPMAKLRATLTEPVIVARCPFCGLGEASTLDHYLPKEENPQFSVLSKNLVPSCSVCNTRKSALVVDKHTSVRCFLHPYFDSIPTERFIALDVTLLSDAIRFVFRMVRPTGMRNRTFQHLRSHFHLLRLADRYCIMSLGHLRDRRRALKRFYGRSRDADRVSRELMTGANDYEEDYGINHWRAILYRTLAANKDFCDGGFAVLDRVQ
jgi:hypothetical protein